MKINEKALSTSNVTSAYEDLQSDASKNTARKECLKKLNKDPIEKAVSASQKKMVRSSINSVQLYLPLYSALPSE